MIEQIERFLDFNFESINFLKATHYLEKELGWLPILTSTRRHFLELSSVSKPSVSEINDANLLKSIYSYGSVAPNIEFFLHKNHFIYVANGEVINSEVSYGQRNSKRKY